MATSSTQTHVSQPVKRSSPQFASAGNLQKQPVDDFVSYWKEYAKQRPEVCAMWCFGIGFVLGWKLKPW